MAFPLRNVRTYSNGDGLCSQERALLSVLRDLTLNALGNGQPCAFPVRLIAARAGFRDSVTLAGLQELRRRGLVSSTDEVTWGRNCET